MNYSIKILEIELSKLQKLEKRFDYTSTTSRNFDIEVINNIAELKRAINILRINNL